MTEVLLSSVALCKGIAGIADNVADEYIIVALREAQQMDLQRVLGAALLSKLKGLVADGTVDAPENAAYKELVDGTQYFLAYQALTAVVLKTSFKISNFGVVRTSDDNVAAAPATDVQTVRLEYQNKADAYRKGLQAYILDHREAFPELTENQCHEMRAHLYAAATGGLYLGGPRGKICR